MVTPIYGPATRTITMKGPPTSTGYKPDHIQIVRRRYNQTKPYNLPLGYTLDSKRIVSFSDTDTTVYKSVADVWYGIPQDLVDNTYNKCYAKFVDKIHNTAEMATNLAEHKQANAMITTRVVQLAKFARALRKFQFGDAAKALGLQRSESPRNLKKTAKAFGNNWLEFHFGWSPLVGDISRSMDILTSGLPPFKVIARTAKEQSLSENLSTSDGKHPWYRNTWYREGFRIQAGFSVANPNLWLANRLGLLNPLGLAWELVPFSFIVDWFVNLNDVLKSSSEFYGLTLINPFRTEFRKVTHSETQLWYQTFGANTYLMRSQMWSSEFCAVGRSLGIPGPTLRVRPAKALSWQRGLTAASLLVQSLKG